MLILANQNPHQTLYFYYIFKFKSGQPTQKIKLSMLNITPLSRTKKRAFKDSPDRQTTPKIRLCCKFARFLVYLRKF